MEFMEKLLTATLNQSVAYFNQDMKISAEIRAEKLNRDTHVLLKYSAMISTVGSVEVDIAIGFEDELFEALAKHFLNDEAVADDKRVELEKSISCEIINIIVGKAITNYSDTMMVLITPPIFIDTMPNIYSNETEEIYDTGMINTPFGKMAILIQCAAQQTTSRQIRSKRLKVLIVDDSLIVRKNMTRLLTMLHQRVIGEAKDGQEAVSMCRDLKPDLITMDITMPDMDGITAIKNIREFDKEVQIIMSTSHGQEKMVLDSIKAGAKGYILKPLTKEKLIASLQKIFPDSI